MAFRTALVAIILIAQHFALPPSTSAQSKAPYAHGSDQVTQKTSGGVLFNPLQQKPVSYEDSSFRMALIGPPGKFALQVEEKATSGGKHFVQLPEEVAQVNEIRRVQGAKAAVVAMVNGDVWECIIVDLNNARLADKFLCYEPNVSPDGQFISFVKFFPPHGGDDPEDHYMLYDLSKDAAGNRPSGVAANDSKAVGVTVYPVGTGNRPFDNIHHAEPAAHRLSSAGFFWNAAGNKVVFADAYEGQISVIAVSISSRRIATLKHHSHAAAQAGHVHS